MTPQRMDVQAAMLWLDLHGAGVRAEMGEQLYDWLGQSKPAAAVRVARAPVELPQVGAASAPLMPRAEGKLPDVKVRPVVATVVPGKVWREGAEGGVVVVLEGEAPLQGRARELLERMLASVDAGAEMAWVGFYGTVSAEEMAESVKALSPTRVLLLGQNVLGALLGKKLGVEGWQAAPCEIPGCVAVGVTYPPALLLAQPLFKRLAWQHLLAWKMGWAA